MAVVAQHGPLEWLSPEGSLGRQKLAYYFRVKLLGQTPRRYCHHLEAVVVVLYCCNCIFGFTYVYMERDLCPVRSFGRFSVENPQKVRWNRIKRDKVQKHSKLRWLDGFYIKGETRVRVLVEAIMNKHCILRYF